MKLENLLSYMIETEKCNLLFLRIRVILSVQPTDERYTETTLKKESYQQ